MRRGLILGVLVILIAIAAVAALLLRPATVIGTSGKSLAYSLRQAAESDARTGCKGEDDRFSCALAAEGVQVGYRVSVDDFGCWEAERRKDGGAQQLSAELDGCITIVDLVRLDD